MSPTAEFWRGKRVFLTGHTGFKGAWLSLWLEEMGALVSGYSLDDFPSAPCLYSALSFEHLHDQRGDIRDYEHLSDTLNAANPEIVLHLAAQPLVRQSYREPVETYATNVMGSVNLLDCVRRRAGVKAVVVVTSDKCYENREWHWAYREDDPMGGHDPYSNSKGCTELLTSSFRHSFFGKDQETQIASARAGNVIGGGDWGADRIVPDCIRAFRSQTPVILRNPQAIRPWQHVLEPLSGYLLLAERLYRDGADFSSGWNFGPNENAARPVEDLVDFLCDYWADGTSWRLAADASAQPHEATFLKIDASKARNLMAWRPQLSLEQTLQWTGEWYKRHAGGKAAQDLCMDQIRAYASLMSAD